MKCPLCGKEAKKQQYPDGYVESTCCDIPWQVVQNVHLHNVDKEILRRVVEALVSKIEAETGITMQDRHAKRDKDTAIPYTPRRGRSMLFKKE